jgi:heptosyltransferase II
MKILIRATNWVGDAIMALPALRTVRMRFPKAWISILARPYVAELYADQNLADELIEYPAGSEHQGWSGRERLAGKLRAKQFDVALLLQNAFDAAWLVWRARVPERIGYARDGRRFLLTRPVGVPQVGEIPPHEKFYYLELLHRVGWLASLDEPTHAGLYVSAEGMGRAAAALSEAGASPGAIRVAIGAGASYGAAKCWPPERFAEFANRLQQKTDAQVILFGTAAEAGVSNAIIAGMNRKPVDLTGKTTIGALPALLSQCHLFVGNDSGTMHVAAAVGLPVVALFGPTDPNGTAPITPRSRIVQHKPYCSPCFLRRCPIDHRCMRGITPQMVEDAAKPWLVQLGVNSV